MVGDLFLTSLTRLITGRFNRQLIGKSGFLDVLLTW